jgi:SNF2 family DNA or RNA helicase
MDKESKNLIKKQFRNPEDFRKFNELINETRVYDPPKSLTGELRPYQKIGYSWLVSNMKYNFGCILADDMGLGKTVQVLATILYYKEMNPFDSEPSLIIVPPTLISNWENEIRKFTPDLTYYIYHGINRIFPYEDYDIILTSYGMIRHDLEMFLDRTWFLCVIDEAQNIKNPNTQQTKAIKKVPALNRIAITGTPIENKLTDYWSIFDFVNKGYLSSLDNFKANYVMRIERLEETKTLEKFKTITKPFVLRRLKTDDNIKDELPDKIVNDIYCTLTKKQVKLYTAITDGIFENLEGKTGIERRGIILNIITGLKQTCNHPAQFLRSDNPKISESGKMELLITILENILDMDEKVIIFTQYAQMGKIIQKLVSKKLKTEVLFLHGSLTQQKRSEVIDDFQENRDCRILVATLKTGGVGLNLTAAQNVIHYDLWWNPAIENQATDRVHRIGQKSDVMVYRFITKGTLEEVIDEMSKNKLNLAEKAISNDETFITEMTNEELKEKLSLRL